MAKGATKDTKQAKAAPQKVQKKSKPKKDKDAPKKAKGGYMFFCDDKRPSVRKAHPDWSITQVASELGAQWQKLTEKEKDKYKKLHEQDKVRYEKEKAAYDSKKK